MTKAGEFATVSAILAGLVLAALLIAKIPAKEETVDQPVNGWDNLCYWKTIHPGEGITENGPGEYEYTLIMTTNGIDVYLPCK